MALNKETFINIKKNEKYIGIRLELLSNKQKEQNIHFGEIKKLLPFFKAANIKFLELGKINAFNQRTNRTLSIFAKDPTLIPAEHWKQIFSNSSENWDDIKHLPFEEKKAKLYQTIAKKQIIMPSNLITFEKNNSFWLSDYILFTAISDYIGSTKFSNWPEDIKSHERKTLNIIQSQLSNRIITEKILQFLADNAYKEFVTLAHQHGIYTSIDINLTCDEHSSEVWGNARSFYLNKNFIPTVYLGLPQSKLLQCGIKYTTVPYRWNELYNNHFDFFRQLFKHYESICDYVHLLNGHTMFQYWEISRFENDPKHGRWVPVKFDLFFEYIRESLGKFAYFLDFNAPLFPDHELKIKRYSLLQSVILNEPTTHSCQYYDLSRPIQMIRSELCNTKIDNTFEKREQILQSATSNIKSILQSDIPVKIVHFDEVCHALNASISNISERPTYYGNILKNLLNGTKETHHTISREKNQSNLTQSNKPSLINKFISRLKKNTQKKLANPYQKHTLFLQKKE